MPLTHAQRKFIVALHRKKERLRERKFLVEGVKGVADLLASDWQVHQLVATSAWQPPELPNLPPTLEVSEADLQRVSALETAQQVLAVACMPPEPDQVYHGGRVLALDDIQDPGNLGTILRLADWFALDAVVCSPGTVERFNPKVVQASMGSLFRVHVQTAPLPAYLQSLPPDTWVAGAFLDGDNLYKTPLPKQGVLVLGNESQGIRPETEALLPQRLHIPRRGQAESLNVATATAIFCSEWTR
ncbi:MAG: RNA methyltransferase [Verrucomicrobia bacterium]|nr:RNA methyltransferase [Verrucomicrobiota bacterium]MCH8512757.1 RNA methyltransferase [Kiritimatiellia bacterium]